MAAPEPASILRMGNQTASDAATKWGVAVESLLSAAHRGSFPPSVADWVTIDEGRGEWRFALGKQRARDIEAMVNADHLHLRAISPEIAAFTDSWQRSEQTSNPQDAPSRTRLVLWCLQAEPDALHVDRVQFVEWCTHQSVGPHDVMLRWRTVSDWYAMLTRSGYPHSQPSLRTRLAVVAEEYEDWPDPEAFTRLP